MSKALHTDPQDTTEFCENIATLAEMLGVNNKTLGIVLPNMSQSRISRLLREFKIDPAFSFEIQTAYDILLEAHLRNVLPVSPRSMTPAILQLIADMIVAETKFAIMTEVHGNPGFESANDLMGYEAIVKKAKAFTI